MENKETDSKSKPIIEIIATFLKIWFTITLGFYGLFKVTPYIFHNLSNILFLNIVATVILLFVIAVGLVFLFTLVDYLLKSFGLKNDIDDPSKETHRRIVKYLGKFKNLLK